MPLHRGLRADRDLARRHVESARHHRLDRQHRHADPFDRGRDPATTTASELPRRRRSARSACAARRSWGATGTGPTRRPRCSPPTAGCAPATWASWTSAATFTITDRKKDMILVSGFKVFPNEIEDVVALHPGRARGRRRLALPDERSGEVVKIVVVRKDPALTEEAADRALPAALTGYKVPEARRVPYRTAAEVERRQDPAPAVARGRGGLKADAARWPRSLEQRSRPAAFRRIARAVVGRPSPRGTLRPPPPPALPGRSRAFDPRRLPDAERAAAGRRGPADQRAPAGGGRAGGQQRRHLPGRRLPAAVRGPPRAPGRRHADGADRREGQRDAEVARARSTRAASSRPASRRCRS